MPEFRLRQQKTNFPVAEGMGMIAKNGLVLPAAKAGCRSSDLGNKVVTIFYTYL